MVNLCNGNNLNSWLNVVLIFKHLVVLLYCCYQRSSCAFKTRISTKWLLSTPSGPLTIPVYAYREMEIATKGFSDKERVGTGGFEIVYLGKLPRKSVAAVKKIRHRGTKGMEQELTKSGFCQV